MTFRAKRYINDSTYQNLSALLNLIKDPSCTEIRLFASPTTATPAYDERYDGPDSNFPLLCACSRHKTGEGFADYTVFDGNLMTAARRQRGSEVRVLLDEAVKCEKVFFGTRRADFTGSSSPSASVTQMLAIPVLKLDETTRAQYWALLSSLTEKAFFDL